MINKNVKRYVGCHVSTAGGLVNAVRQGAKFSLNTIQLHPSPPQRWNAAPYPAGYEDAFVAERRGSCVEKVFFHAIYLINLANPDPKQAALSQRSLVHYLDLLARVEGDGVIVHVGSLKDEPDETAGFLRAAEAINSILDRVPAQARLLLEVAAGSGAVIGDRMEELAVIYEAIKKKDQVGFALDSQHLWASGYDLRENLSGVLEEVGRVFGFDKVGAIHLNDSKTACASRKDRHENLGDGCLGMACLTAFLNAPQLAHIPFILETPNLKDDAGIGIEVDKLRGMVAARER